MGPMCDKYTGNTVIHQLYRLYYSWLILRAYIHYPLMVGAEEGVGMGMFFYMFLVLLYNGPSLPMNNTTNNLEPNYHCKRYKKMQVK